MLVDTTDLVKPWLMYLDSISDFNHSDDLAIRLYNVTTEDDYGAWDDWVSEVLANSDDSSDLNYILSDDISIVEFTDTMNSLLITPIDTHFQKMGMEVVCIRDSSDPQFH